MTSGEAETEDRGSSSERKTETISWWHRGEDVDRWKPRAAGQSHCLSWVRWGIAHTIGSWGFVYARYSALNRTRPLPAMVRISQVLFDSKFPLQIDSIWWPVRQNAALNKAAAVDGRGLFLRGRSQETPSPLLSFLLFSLAASARPLLSFLMSAASAARTPSRLSLSPLQAPLVHLPRPLPSSDLPAHSKAEHSPSSQQSAVRFDPVQQPHDKGTFFYLLVSGPYNCSSARKQRRRTQ